jgi:hypothetical protein
MRAFAVVASLVAVQPCESSREDGALSDPQPAIISSSEFQECWNTEAYIRLRPEDAAEAKRQRLQQRREERRLEIIATPETSEP